MSRWVESEHQINEWTRAVSRDGDLPGRTKLMLIGISNFLDRNTWSANVSQSMVSDDLNESRSTMNPHWKKALGSPYVAKVGSHEYKAGSRTMMGPTLRLVMPG